MGVRESLALGGRETERPRDENIWHVKAHLTRINSSRSEADPSKFYFTLTIILLSFYFSKAATLDALLITFHHSRAPNFMVKIRVHSVH